MKFSRRRAYYAPERPKVDQHGQRLRRRRWLPNHLTAEFDLGTEIAALTIPLCARVALDPVPRVYRDQVQGVADSVAACVREIGDVIGSGDDRRRTEHLSEPDRRRALDLLRSRRTGTRHTVTEDELTSGSWSDGLVELAASTSEPLSQLLGRSLPPGKAIPSASELVENALRNVDRAVLSLERRLDRRAADRELFSRDNVSTPTIESQLEELGVRP